MISHIRGHLLQQDLPHHCYLAQRAFFHFPMQDYHPFLMNLELKIYIFPHIHALSAMQQVYMQVAPLQPMYIGICAKKYKTGVGFPCHDKRSMILGLPYTRNILNQPFLMNLELKIYIFPHIHALSAMQQVYMQVAPLQPMYIGICAKKYKTGVGFPCHDKRSMILGLPYTRNIMNQPFNCILKAIRAQFRAMEKKRKHSTLREKLLWRNYFILGLHPFVPQV
jgi:hypothetical protein